MGINVEIGYVYDCSGNRISRTATSHHTAELLRLFHPKSDGISSGLIGSAFEAGGVREVVAVDVESLVVQSY